MKTTWFVSFLSALVLAGCGSVSDAPLQAQETSGPAALAWAVAPLASSSAARKAVAARAEVGGRLVVTLANPSLLVHRTDTLSWDGSDTLRSSFGELPEGAGYRLRAEYVDARGLHTHADSTPVFALSRARTLPLSLLLRPVLGKILLQFPEIPDGVDTLSLGVTVDGTARQVLLPRPTGGRGSLRLDSLPLGMSLPVRLRAWGAGGDTLYFLDTTVSLDGASDQALAWNLASARAGTGLSLGFSAGGEAAASVGFGSAPLQAGGLLLTAFSDSGASDWIRLRNVLPDSFCQSVRIARGTVDTVVALRLGPGEEIVLTRAGETELARTTHPLHGMRAITASVASVTWSATGGTVWKLTSPDGSLVYDQVYALPGKSGWPSLNTGVRRTAALRRSNATSLGNDAGSGWCALGSDSPAAACAD